MDALQETYRFQDVFQNAYLEANVRQITEQIEITNIVLDRKKEVLYIYMNVWTSMKAKDLENLKKSIEKYFDCTLEIELIVDFLDKDGGIEDQVLQCIWEYCLGQMKKDAPVCCTILQNSQCEIRDNGLVVCVEDTIIYLLKNRQIINEIQSLAKLFFRKDIQIEIKPVQRTKEYPKTAEVIPIESLIPKSQVCETKGRQIGANEKGSIILGKKITGQATPISEIKEEEPNIIIKGTVLDFEFREIKDDRFIISVDLTDDTDSITAKSFVKKKIFEEKIKGRLKKDEMVLVQGNIQYDSYQKEIIVRCKNMELIQGERNLRMDMAPEKRVELHVHTQMSNMDSVADLQELVSRAALWGHKAIAITDHGVVQAYPDAAAAAKKHDIKILYGVEAYLVDDLKKIVQYHNEETLDDTLIVFDIETTGLKAGRDQIIEIGAVKIRNREIIDTFSSFINPLISIPPKITKLTGITDEMVRNAPTIQTVFPQFMEFAEDGVLIAHNAAFDVGFLRMEGNRVDYPIHNPVLDTLELVRSLFPSLKNHKLNTVADHLSVSLENHHRAVDDAAATAQIFMKCIPLFEEKKCFHLGDINGLKSEHQVDIKKLSTYHALILVKNQKGLKNLYQLISKAHIEYFHRKPRIPKSEYMNFQEGLMIGSACEAGELYQAILHKEPKEKVVEIGRFYDFLEIQPLGNNQFLLEKQFVKSKEELIQINKDIVALGEELKKPVVATCDVHFIDPKDEVYRRILQAGQGYEDAGRQPPLYFRTTEEMLEEFSYMGKEKAYEIVITNTNAIADSIEVIKPIPDGTFPPHIDGSEEELTRITMEKAASIYGNPLPEPVKERLDRELNSIIKNGFAVLYIIAQKLVWKSLEDGYLVGSRGSVGSSFVATMAGITEVNPLPPHYVCPNCKYSDFKSEVVQKFAGGSGCDMPDAVCPKCGNSLNKEGHDIPFETFLGFDGDKEPDIDLNFSGEYQPRAHAYTEELFGEGHVFRAGTIGTLAEKTAFGYVKKYIDEKELECRNAEIKRLVKGCTGVRRTSGQHPGGQMVVPGNHDIYEFCPIQRPANDMKSTTITTHFDYHSISGRLLKLDILGHDDPTVIRMLEDLTGIDAQKIPLDDQKVMSLFTSTEALGVTSEDINCQVGALGLPEFGTRFVRQMLMDTQPRTFSDLIRISGLSHGTDVWLNNAQELVRNNTVTLSETISTRDDIMVYLILRGVEKKLAFKIMEKVRKGKGLAPEDEEAMKDASVPDWYIESCKKIKYMFPKAHAAAYVMMAFRIAYFKVYYPKCFYAAFFSIRADDFDYAAMCNGKEQVQRLIDETLEKGNNASKKEKDILTILEIVREMVARGISFVKMDLYRSDATKFLITEEGILPPLNSLQGLGDTAALNIVEARKNGEFLSIEEFRQRTKVSKTVIDIMKQHQILIGLPETNQLSLFS